MSLLTIYQAQSPYLPCEVITQQEAIQATLYKVGIRFEQWPVVAMDSFSADNVQKAYETHIQKEAFDHLEVTQGNQAMSGQAALREKLLAEHSHDNTELRFMADGQALFYFHVEPYVYIVQCCAGDLISVPAGTKHWFDMGDKPQYTTLRFFNNEKNQQTDYTGSGLSQHFPKLQSLKGIKAIITDIDGTIAELNLIHNTLSPYAKAHLSDEIKDSDSQQYNGRHLYADAVSYLVSAYQSGVKLYSYSSASVTAQDTLYKHSYYGDIRSLFSHYFDTSIGSKRDSYSYQKILNMLPFAPGEIIFYSDLLPELVAANQIGIQCVQVKRGDGDVESGAFPVVKRFDEEGNLKSQ